MFTSAVESFYTTYSKAAAHNTLRSIVSYIISHIINLRKTLFIQKGLKVVCLCMKFKSVTIIVFFSCLSSKDATSKKY